MQPSAAAMSWFPSKRIAYSAQSMHAPPSTTSTPKAWKCGLKMAARKACQVFQRMVRFLMHVSHVCAAKERLWAPQAVLGPPSGPAVALMSQPSRLTRMQGGVCLCGRKASRMMYDVCVQPMTASGRTSGLATAAAPAGTRTTTSATPSSSTTIMTLR